jgi:Tfp pilus assembly protein PilN
MNFIRFTRASHASRIPGPSGPPGPPGPPPGPPGAPPDVPPGATPATAMARLRRRLARLLPPGAGHVSRISFVPAPVPLSGWRLALLAAGLLALAPAAISWNARQQAVARLEAQLAQARPRTITRPARAPAEQRALEQQVKAVAAAVRQLNLPVTRLIKTVQAPRDMHVALLALDLNSQPAADGGGAPAVPAGALKIAAEAETMQDMINYLAFLDQQPLFQSVYLVKHEMNVNAPDHPYRFQMEAQWHQ